jgi:hypothetical protein
MQRHIFATGIGLVFSLAAWLCPAQVQTPIILNEIHYNPDVKTEPVEFVELFNRATNAVSLAGWQLSSAIEFTFPAGTAIAGRGYLVVAQNPGALFAKFGVRALGPYTNQLSHYGERIVLQDSTGHTANEVNYKLGFPWPTVGDPPGYSIELIHPDLDNDLGGSWRASLNGSPVSQTLLLLADHSTWKYRKGTNEASSPTTTWRQPGFDDSAWTSGRTPVGYDPSLSMGTPLNDMSNRYSSVFLRTRFVATNIEEIGSLLLEAMYDDGFKVWINGTNVLNANISTNELPFNGVAGVAREDAKYNLFTLSAPGFYLAPGTNVIAVQAHNSSLAGNNDFFIDIRLLAQYGPPNRGPTPGGRNSVYATNAPPQIRQVAHQPEQPSAGQAVKITAKITDPGGVASATLQYQVVEPGKYIELTDAAYATNWISLPMRDDGGGADAVAGDDIYTAEAPATVQTHRRLIRYRITASDRAGLSIRVPYADDPQPNFAYFVYNGVPAWRGAVRPGTTPALDFGSNVMGRLPVYHLIAKSNIVATATWFSRYGGDLYQWAGTLVYDGQVYDHIHYRARGGVWRYSMCKNMWKFDLNRGHDFEARDNWGKKYKTTWTKLNLGASIQQGDFNHRGEQGMFESVGFRLFQLMGVASPHTAFVTFRVIDDALEADARTQYEGDFWGLYLATEQENGQFLEEHGLPDGNFYKMEGGTGELNNLGPNGPLDKSDLNTFLNIYTSSTNANLTEAWWRANFNLPKYYGYQCVVQAVHHYDIADGKNYFYYLHPQTRQWEVFPWDLDLIWADNMYRSGQQGGDEPFKSRVLGNFAYPGARPVLGTEFRNRAREFRDLLWNNDQAFKMIDEYAALVRGPTNAPTILDADRCMWDYNPKMSSSTYSDNPGSKAGTGRFYQWPNEPTVTKDFKGCLQLMKNYVLYRASNTVFSLDTMANEPLRPSRPTLLFTGPTNYPANRLSFRASNFGTPYPSNKFAAVKWRLAEITDPRSPAYDPAEPWAYEITPVWESGPRSTFNPDLVLPPNVARIGHRYRARVQMLDQAGRASNWSLPVEFACGDTESAADLVNYLRITEVMYNPPPGAYEFVELHNLSTTVALDLSGARFSAGIDYAFAPGTVIPPGGFLLVIGTPNEAAFRAYYGLDESVAIVGPYSGSLNNGGETITLRTGLGGTEILSFTYKDGRGWPAEADGAGHSLALLDSAQANQGAGAAEFGGNWRASAYFLGSPGRADIPPARTIVLNEIAAHTHWTNELSSNDWLELYNATDADLVLGPGWFLSDDGAALTKWAIPAGTLIRARGWISFDELTGFHNPTNIGFGLSQAGEQVFLTYVAGTPQDRIVDCVSFKGQEEGWSWGRYPDGDAPWQALPTPTRGAANAPPAPHVVMSELMYHPPDLGGTNDNALDEFLELANPTSQPVAFSNPNGPWRIDGGISLTFPTNFILDAGDYVLLVNFNPTNAAQLAAFRATYGLTNVGPAILGPYSGKLDNSSDRVALERPQGPDPAGSPASWVMVDEVIYADQAPWPCDTDGTGNSLQRTEASRPGSNPENWLSGPPTPGAPPKPLPPASPIFVAQPASQAVPTNGAVSFSVAVCGTPPFVFQWSFNGQPITGATNAALILRAARAADAGDYWVLVTNAGGAITSAPARLDVLLPPMITTHPQSQTVIAGDTVSFNGSAEGSVPLFYQWRVNGTNLPGATNQTLTLTNVQFGQSGRYTLLAYNAAAAAASSNALLTVNVPAAILVPPVSVLTNAGSNVTFTVTASGTEPLLYQWQREGTNLDGATTASLALTNVQPSAAGIYTVRVSNAYGSTSSPPAVLSVLYGPIPLQGPQSQTVAAGSTVTLTATADGTWPITYRWRRNAGYYPATYAPTNSSQTTLVLTNVQFTNLMAGAYYVQLSNVNSKSVSIYSPTGYVTIVRPPTNQVVAAGAGVAFGVSVTSKPPVTLQWQMNGANLRGATNDTLYLTNVGSLEAGAYAVVVTVLTNVPIPPATFSATLQVLVSDRDGDGLPDAWELAHGLNPADAADAALDADRDGLTNLQEYLAGTDPRDPQSVLKLGGLSAEPGGTNVVVRFRFGAVTNHTYSVLFFNGPTTGAWERLLEVNADAPTNRLIQVTNAVPATIPQRYYRVVTPKNP